MHINLSISDIHSSTIQWKKKEKGDKFHLVLICVVGSTNIEALPCKIKHLLADMKQNLVAKCL